MLWGCDGIFPSLGDDLREYGITGNCPRRLHLRLCRIGFGGLKCRMGVVGRLWGSDGDDDGRLRGWLEGLLSGRVWGLGFLGNRGGGIEVFQDVLWE